MNQDPSYAAPITGEPPAQAKKKGGCGCCLGGCLTTLALVVILLIGGGAALWYGAKSFTVPDQAVIWTYQNLIRPKILETLPPSFSAQKKQQVLQAADFGLERYLKLSSAEKKALGKEMLTAIYYYSQDKVIPPDEIPNLSKFVEETQQAYQRGGKRP